MGLIRDQYLRAHFKRFSGLDVFFDTNSFLIQKELQSQIESLEAEKKYLEGEIEKDRKALKNLSSDEAMEKFARERYFMKKKNEAVFIIEYQDSILDE